MRDVDGCRTITRREVDVDILDGISSTINPGRGFAPLSVKPRGRIAGRGAFVGSGWLSRFLSIKVVGLDGPL